MRNRPGKDVSLCAGEIAGCRRCPRLTAYCESFTLPENQSVKGFHYWARPVPGFGDRDAELLIIGLAPGAHGANRTGRPFTGDAAGVSVSGNEVLVIVSSPAGFDADLAIATLKKLMEIRASRIYFAHFGASHEVQKNLQRAIDTLQSWNDIIAESLSDSRRNGVAERLMAHAYAVLAPIRNKSPLLYEYLINHNMPMSIDGHLKYYQKKHGIELN